MGDENRQVHYPILLVYILKIFHNNKFKKTGTLGKIKKDLDWDLLSASPGVCKCFRLHGLLQSLDDAIVAGSRHR